jgi:integrase
LDLFQNYLKNLNDKREIRNFKFLEKPKKILEKIKDYKLTTQRNILIAIVSVLKNLGNDLYKSYYDLMIEYNKKIEDGNKNNEKTETQKNNWMEFKDVENKFNELKSKLKGSSNISENMYDNYLNAVVLGLYVLTPPRRNKDYLLMKVSKDGKNMNDKYNWLDIKKKQFIFNNYKTDKTYGQQIVDIPTELFELIKKYLKYKKDGDNYLLVKFNGNKLTSDNSITRLLNKIFGKNISSSMLRHIYLTNRFKDVNKEMQDTALKMGHSVFQQKDYIKK